MKEHIKRRIEKTTIFILLVMVFSVLTVSAWNFSGGEPVSIVSPLESNGAIPVNIQDQHTEIIDLKLTRHINNVSLLSNVAIDDYDIHLSSISVPTVEQVLCLKEGEAFYQAEPLNIVSTGGDNYTLTMDTPFDYAFTTAAYGCISSSNLAVDGSVTPVIFRVTPANLESGVEWDITRFILIFGGYGIGAQNDAPDDGDFGVTSALTRGIVLRVSDGISKNIFNAKMNGELRARSYDLQYTPASKAGIYSVAMRRTFAGQNKNGVTVRLTADSQDELQIIIQDDLTEMTGGMAIAQGHIVQD